MPLRLSFWGILGLAAWLLVGNCRVAAQGKEAAAAKIAHESAPALARLAGVQQKVEAGQWATVVEEYQSILEELGNELVPLPGAPAHFISVRRFCQLRLAALPAAALRLYRTRVDDQAKKWLDRAVATRDPALLRRIVDDAFVSRHAARALELLGDLAFERGDFLEAENYWRMLALPCSEATRPRVDKTLPELQPIFPDPEEDPALVRAKQILALLFRGSRPAAVEELKAYRAAHPQAAGLLGGLEGSYAETLQAFVERKDLVAPASADADWATFAGDSSRNLVFHEVPRCRWLEQAWRVRLDGQPPNGVGDSPPARAKSATEANRALGCFPVIVGERVLVADAVSVSVLDLLTGKRLDRWELPEDGKRPNSEGGAEPVARGEKHTLTVVGDRVFARLGATAFGFPREGKADRLDSFLVCLKLERSGKLTPLWRVPGRQQVGEAALFEGSPVVHADRAYLARTRFTRSWAATEIECYHAETGTRRWRREACEGQELNENSEPRYRPQLLTLAGANVVYCSHAGAVVALELASGRPAWARRYPRRGYRLKDGTLSPRDLCPCLHDAGRVYVAPADCDRIFCLDATTGRQLWESKPLEVVQLLGVAGGKLIFTTAAQPRGIRAIDAKTGDDLRGWLQPEDGDDGRPATLGRGALAGDRVLWPVPFASETGVGSTNKGLVILNQANGQRSDQDFVPLETVHCGNLALGNGAVVIASQHELFGYVRPERFLEERKQAAANAPGSAVALYWLAVALADAGQHETALKHFGQLALDGKGGAELALQASRQAVRLFIVSLQTDTDEVFRRVRTALPQALATRLPETVQLQAAVRSAKSSEPAAALAAWQQILADERLRHLTFMDASGKLQPAAAHAVRQIAALQKAHGPLIYAEQEKAARQLVAAGADEAGLQTLDRLAESFANATVTREVFERLALRFERQRQYERAADVNRRLLALNEGAAQAPPLARLALAYEGLKYWEEARHTWERLAREHPAIRLDALDAKRPLRAAVADRLERADLKPRLSAGLPELPLPLRPAWQVALATGLPQPFTPATEQLFLPEIPPAGEQLLLFQRPAGLLLARDAGSGQLRWQTPFSQAITWLGRHADLMLAGGPRTAVALRQTDGKIVWKFNHGGPDEEGGDPLSAGFDGFQLAAGRLFFLQDRRRLLALDVETGRPLWSWAAPAAVPARAPSAEHTPHILASACRVLVQTGARRLLLDSATGETIQAVQSLPPPPAPSFLLLDDTSAAVRNGRRELTCLDLRSGKPLWSHQTDRASSLTGAPPQVIGHGSTLLIAVPRNYGTEADRLNVNDGSRHWARPIILPRAFPDLSRAAHDETALYLVVGAALEAYSLADGRRLWRTVLPGQPIPPPGAGEDSGGGWQALAAANGVFVFPVEATLNINLRSLLRRQLPFHPTTVMPTLAVWPLGMSSTGLVVLRARVQAPSKLPLLVFDPKDGRLLQQLILESRGPYARVALHQRRLTVALADAVAGFE